MLEGKLYDQKSVLLRFVFIKSIRKVYIGISGIKQWLYVCRHWSTHTRCKRNSRGLSHMVVNPRQKLMIQSDSYRYFPPEKSRYKIELQAAFHALLEVVGFFNDQLDDYYLSRVDLYVRYIRCDHKKIFREVVRVLRKLPTRPKYKRMSRKEKDKKKGEQVQQAVTSSLVLYT